MKKSEEECIVLDALCKSGVTLTPQIRAGISVGLKALRAAKHKENYERKQAN